MMNDDLMINDSSLLVYAVFNTKKKRKEKKEDKNKMVEGKTTILCSFHFWLKVS